MNKDIVIKKSKIAGRGVFANRDFKKGEVVLKWNPKIIKKSDLEKLSSEDRHYIFETEEKIFLMQSPERFMNHSCEPNTKAKNEKDIALVDIKKGEEITTSYNDNGRVEFQCSCHSKNCKQK